MTRTPRGFTIVEVLVATLFIDVALLACVATSALVVRRQVELRTRVAAADAAANRMQTAAVGACAATSGVSAAARGVVEHWSVAVIGGTRSIRDSVTYHVGTTERAIVLESRAPC